MIRIISFETVSSSVRRRITVISHVAKVPASEALHGSRPHHLDSCDQLTLILSLLETLMANKGHWIHVRLRPLRIGQNWPTRTSLAKQRPCSVINVIISSLITESSKSLILTSALTTGRDTAALSPITPSIAMQVYLLSLPPLGQRSQL